MVENELLLAYHFLCDSAVIKEWPLGQQLTIFLTLIRVHKSYSKIPQWLSNSSNDKQDTGETECATISTTLTGVILTSNDLMLSSITSGMRKPAT